MGLETDSNKEKSLEYSDNVNVIRQIILHFCFSVLMILFNIIIQNFHKNFIFPFISDTFTDSNFIQRFYLSQFPYDLPEIYGSVLAVGITYICKFFLDKYVVFKDKRSNVEYVGKQFSIYLILAIITTLENLGIQFILHVITNLELNLRIAIALTCGYITKYILDKIYCFKNVNNKMSKQ